MTTFVIKHPPKKILICIDCTSLPLKAEMNFKVNWCSDWSRPVVEWWDE